MNERDDINFKYGFLLGTIREIQRASESHSLGSCEARLRTIRKLLLDTRIQELLKEFYHSV